MAEEPQPDNIQEGADPPDVLPASAEDRKAAKAMSSLESNKIEDDSPKKEVDLKALNAAINKLGGGDQKKSEAVKKDEGPPKPLVKVDAADVTLLSEQLDITKPKATELLRAHDADAVKAMTAYVDAPV